MGDITKLRMLLGVDEAKQLQAQKEAAARRENKVARGRSFTQKNPLLLPVPGQGGGGDRCDGMGCCVCDVVCVLGGVATSVAWVCVMCVM